MDTSEFWVLLSLTLEQRHALRPQLQDSLAQICTDAWKACLRACTSADAVRLVLSIALGLSGDNGTCLRSSMLLELLERRCIRSIAQGPAHMQAVIYVSC